MNLTAPYHIRLTHAVVAVGRQLPHEPLGDLVRAIFVWRRLPMLAPSTDGQRWNRYSYDKESGRRVAMRPNQFATLIKRTANTPAESAILIAALHRVGKGGLTHV